MTKLSTVLCSFLTLGLAAGAAEAASHRVNIEPVRAHLESRLNKAGTGLKLGPARDATKPIAGISAKAAERAISTQRGFQGFGGHVRDASIHVIQMGKQRLIVTKAPTQISTAEQTPTGWKNTSRAVQRFVARSSQQGLVVARGFVDGGKLVWTRSHNGQTRSMPAERNAGK